MRALKAVILGVVLAAALTPVAAVAGPFEDGLEAVESGDYETALWRSLAEQGDADAQSYLGTMYHFGQDVPQDYATAIKWYRLAAEQGDADAQAHLGFLYHEGQGVPQDYAEAVKWYRRAAEQGNAKAQSNLGVMYYEGQGVSQDHAEAVKWFQLAAEQGHAKAQNNIGVMYARGKGVPQDYVQAHMWSNLAASRMLPGEDHDKAVEQRDAVAERMAPAQIAEAQKLARDWRPVGEQAD